MRRAFAPSLRRNLSRIAGALVVIAALGFGAVVLRGAPQFAELTNDARDSSAPSHFRVIDGDTLDDTAAGVRYRVVNIDTPERGQGADCAAERDAAERATQAVRTLIRAAQRVEARPVGRTDRYGRTVAFVLVDGRDLGQFLIAEGLARPWRGRREPWCGAGGELLASD